MTNVKALTLYEPWATMVALGVKRIETRSWPTPYRGVVAIHASKRFDSLCLDAAGKEPMLGYLRTSGKEAMLRPTNKDCFTETRGRIIAIADLIGCVLIPKVGVGSELIYQVDGHTTSSRITLDEWNMGWFGPGRFAWIFASVRELLLPIPATGSLGLWDVTLDNDLIAYTGAS